MSISRIYIIDTQDMSKVANTRNPALRASVKSRKISRGLDRRLWNGGEPQLVNEGYSINPLLSTPTSRCRGVIKTARNRRG